MAKQPPSKWFVKRRGKSDLGPMSHREARVTALTIARAGVGIPELYRQVAGETVHTLKPRFPELLRG